MIIDFVNYTLYHPGAEASILFHLHEYGLRVPRFFCIPEQYEPEELDAYFAMHFQDVLQYHVWMTATIVVSENKTDRTEWMPNCKADLPVYTNVKKYALYRNIERILESRESYRQKIAAAESVSPAVSGELPGIPGEAGQPVWEHFEVLWNPGGQGDHRFVYKPKPDRDGDPPGRAEKSALSGARGGRRHGGVPDQCHC